MNRACVGAGEEFEGRSITWLGKEMWSMEWEIQPKPTSRRQQISCEWEKEVILHEVRRYWNPHTEGWELFQAGRVGEMRMLKEYRESLVCVKCTWTMVWLFDYFYFFHPWCSSGLNSPFPHLAISTIATVLCAEQKYGKWSMGVEEGEVQAKCLPLFWIWSREGPCKLGQHY